MTTIYWKCSNCNHQKTSEFPVGHFHPFIDTCEWCGEIFDRKHIGLPLSGPHSKPSWWDGSKEAEVTP